MYECGSFSYHDFIHKLTGIYADDNVIFAVSESRIPALLSTHKEIEKKHEVFVSTLHT